MVKNIAYTQIYGSAPFTKFLNQPLWLVYEQGLWQSSSSAWAWSHALMLLLGVDHIGRPIQNRQETRNWVAYRIRRTLEHGPAFSINIGVCSLQTPLSFWLYINVKAIGGFSLENLRVWPPPQRPRVLIASSRVDP